LGHGSGVEAEKLWLHVSARSRNREEDCHEQSSDVWV
jgi:hypothetical protein